jgi:pyruvate carboxylase subunit B
MKYQVQSNGLTLTLDIDTTTPVMIMKAGDREFRCEAQLVQPGVYSILLNNRSFLVAICDEESGQVNVEGRPLEIEVLDDIHLRLKELGWDAAQDSSNSQVVAQIPGLVTAILHIVGDSVEQGEPLFLMEAMKMENEIKAPLGGVIQKISVKEGQTVEKGTIVIEIV